MSIEEELSIELSQKYKEANKQVKVLAEKYHVGVNADSGKFEAFQMYLMEIGVLTREQLLRFELQHIEKAILTMNDLQAQAQTEIRKKSLIKPTTPKGGLIGPNGRPIGG